MMKTDLSTIISGSLAEQAKTKNQPLAETFISADVVVIVDTSGSMCNTDATSQSRYERACAELGKLQNSLPGKIAVLSFSSDVMFCPSGVPWNFQAATDLEKALKFAKVADVADMKFIVISDGDPDDEKAALKVAASYKCKIDTIFIGREGDSGQLFLAQLAAASGGKSAKDFSAAKLENTVKGLLYG
jgi:Mg-chelatase subunit ChlD